MAQPIQICLALTTLYDAVLARFEKDQLKVESHFGWREPQKYKEGSSRIVWVPGDPGSNVGDIQGPRNPGQNPRSLGTLAELFTVQISGRDFQFPEDERKQYVATRLLYDAWFRAVYLAAHGTFAVRTSLWNTSKNERRHGAEIICVCEIESPIPDAVQTLAPDDSGVEVTTILDDVSELTITS